MPYLIVALIFFIIQTVLIQTVKINIYPEFFFLPWLVKNGLLPYRDFFDHHGFILYYLLSPLSIQKNLLLIGALFIFFQSINLMLVLSILKKARNLFSFSLGGFLYLLLSFYIAENTIWYELIITTVYLLLYYSILEKEFRFKNFIVALLIFFASLIKPTSAFILLPILFFYRSLSILLIFSLAWSIVVGYFFIQGGLNYLFDNLVLFNIYYTRYFSRQSLLFSDQKLFFGMLFVAIASHAALFFITRRNTTLFLFTLCSLIFIVPTHTKMNLTTFVVFLSISVSAAVSYLLRHKGIFFLFFCIVATFLFMVFYKTGRHYFFLKTDRITYLENSTVKRLAHHLANDRFKRKKTYILSNQVELYYSLNQIPPTYFPIIFPWISSYYPNLQNRIIDDLKKNKIRTVVIPIPIDENYLPLSKLIEFIKSNFNFVEQTGEFQIYTI